MEENDKNKTTYTKNMLIKKVANECRRNVNIVQDVYDSLERNITHILSSANQDTDVSIRLFEGISLHSSFVPEKIKVNNLTGKTIKTSSKIVPKAKITRNYREKLTDCENQ